MILEYNDFQLTYFRTVDLQGEEVNLAVGQVGQ